MVAFAMTSPAFTASSSIPAKYTADGPDLSPPLQWTAPPGTTKSFVLIVDDPDAPAGTWTHWVLVGIPPDRRSLPEGVETSAKPGGLGGAFNGKNSFGRTGWGGPSPPKGPPHHYVFKLYALDTALKPGTDVSKESVTRMMKGHIVAEAELVALYGR